MVQHCIFVLKVCMFHRCFVPVLFHSSILEKAVGTNVNTYIILWQIQRRTTETRHGTGLSYNQHQAHYTVNSVTGNSANERTYNEIPISL
jgi:hypothetical protein